MLRVEHLSKRFGTLQALNDVGFEVERGQMVGFLGPNGAGKTTTMRAIMQMVTLDHGSITWDGTPVNAELRQRFGYMPAERGMYQRMTVKDHLLYYAKLSGLKGAEPERVTNQWMERLDLSHRADATVQSLSSGNQQRVQLAIAILNEPELLVLDEPFSGLDPIAVETLSEVLREQVDRGAALLLSSHQLDLVADLCSAVVIVNSGSIALRGEVSQLRSSSPIRYVTVEFERATEWTPTAGTNTVKTNNGQRYRVTLPAGTDPHALISEASSKGTVTSYAFAPPDLSEVFFSTVNHGENKTTIPSASHTGNTATTAIEEHQ